MLRWRARFKTSAFMRGRPAHHLDSYNIQTQQCVAASRWMTIVILIDLNNPLQIKSPGRNDIKECCTKHFTKVRCKDGTNGATRSTKSQFYQELTFLHQSYCLCSIHDTEMTSRSTPSHRSWPYRLPSEIPQVESIQSRQCFK